jgi:two-component system alkaline phosphatase synthesis response regulator PhoP
MDTTSLRDSKTRIGTKTAYVLGDADVWPSEFEAALENAGFSVASFNEMHELFDRSHDEAPNLLIIAKRNARFAVRGCQAVRGLQSAPNVVVIPDESTFVAVMDAGADDAVTASSDPEVFAARVRALLRRARRWEANQNSGILAVRDLRIDLDKCEVVLRGRTVALTPTEFRILAVLSERAGKVIDARSLLSAVHEHDYDDREAQNLVKVHIANLRRKLEDGRDGNSYILCVRGFGYMMERRSTQREDDPLNELIEA